MVYGAFWFAYSLPIGRFLSGLGGHGRFGDFTKRNKTKKKYRLLLASAIIPHFSLARVTGVEIHILILHRIINYS